MNRCCYAPFSRSTPRAHDAPADSLQCGSVWCRTASRDRHPALASAGRTLVRRTRSEGASQANLRPCNALNVRRDCEVILGSQIEAGLALLSATARATDLERFISDCAHRHAPFVSPFVSEVKVASQRVIGAPPAHAAHCDEADDTRATRGRWTLHATRRSSRRRPHRRCRPQRGPAIEVSSAMRASAAGADATMSAGNRRPCTDLDAEREDAHNGHSRSRSLWPSRLSLIRRPAVAAGLPALTFAVVCRCDAVTATTAGALGGVLNRRYCSGLSQKVHRVLVALTARDRAASSKGEMPRVGVRALDTGAGRCYHRARQGAVARVLTTV